MGDMADDFNAMKEASKERRANNREQSAALLTEAGIEFESKNDGAHLIVGKKGFTRINFWPGTGLWMSEHCKSPSQRNYGVKNLIHFLQGGKPKRRKP